MDRLAARAHMARRTIIDHMDCEDCAEDYVFLMSLDGREFTLGLSTVLAAVAFAEREGAVPVLPDGWWNQVASRYQCS